MYATVPENLENEKIVEADSLRLFNDIQEDEVVKIYETDGALLINLGNTITTPIVIINVDYKKVFPESTKKI